jgi:hypothetical protein
MNTNTYKQTEIDKDDRQTYTDRQTDRIKVQMEGGRDIE